jgi:hypothetical protein
VSTLPHKRKSDLLSRAAESQRRNGKLPDTRTDDSIWTGVLAEMERKASEDKLAPKLDRNPTRSAAEALSRDGAELLDSKAARRDVKRLSPKRGSKSVEAKLACRRLRVLSLMPEWSLRVVEAMNRGARLAHVTKTKDMRLLVWLEVRKVLDASNAAIGRAWDRLPERNRVSVSG